MVRFDGHRQCDVARLFKVSQATISYIMNAPIHSTVSRFRKLRREKSEPDHKNGSQGPFHGNQKEFVEPWAPKVRAEPLPLPVVDNGFIRPPTRQQLMGRK
jgi:hypothetical protein